MTVWVHATGPRFSAVWIEGKPETARLVYLGPALGHDFEPQALAQLDPRTLWGARHDEPVPIVCNTGGQTLFEHDRESQTIRIESRNSLDLAFTGRLSRLLTVRGDWAAEFRIEESDLSAGRISLSGGTARHGHDAWPGVILAEPGCTEDAGPCLGIVLNATGPYNASAAMTREGSVHVRLAVPGAPVIATLAFSDGGLNGLSQALARACPSPRSTAPVHLNTWEAVYFAHDQAKLRALSDAAAEAGVERFVLDDGWFKGRKDDTSGLGDWTPDPAKYPDGLRPLADHVRARGMEFGLWVEPEMVNPDSDLFRAHPDWVLRLGEALQPPMRHQQALDLRKPGVRTYLADMLRDRIAESGASYLKWDMNRDMVLHGLEETSYAEALHRLMREAAALGVEIEACASGGGRCDWGVMEICARAWISDQNDALDRLRINRGASYVLPLRVMGTHVGPHTCHTTGRRLGLDLRAHVALFGWFGVEADITQWTSEERARLAAHIANYKRLRHLIHDGLYWRLETHEPDHLADAVTAEDQSHALLRVVRTGSSRLGQGTNVRLPGLDPEARYTVSVLRPAEKSVEAGLAPAIADGTLVLTGRVLAARGLDLWMPRPATSLILEFVRA